MGFHPDDFVEKLFARRTLIEDTHRNRGSIGGHQLHPEAPGAQQLGGGDLDHVFSLEESDGERLFLIEHQFVVHRLCHLCTGIHEPDGRTIDADL